MMMRIPDDDDFFTKNDDKKDERLEKICIPSNDVMMIS